MNPEIESPDGAAAAPPPETAPAPAAQSAKADTNNTPTVDTRSFAELGLREEVVQALTEMGFYDPMPVQRAVLPKMLAGKDLIVQSKTGSGKTAAFGIPLAESILDPGKRVPQALVLAPTRELALQVHDECKKIGQYRHLEPVAIYGGAPMGKQIDALKAGVHMVAGTPGRVLDHLGRGTLSLKDLKVLILDEADEMLSMGFLEEITEIIKRCPKDRQTVLFSATMPDDVERIAQRYMREPEKLSLSADGVGAREIHHAYYMVSGMGRVKDLVRVLEVERPESAIIFCNTREETNHVAEYLRKNGYDAEAISSDLTQKDRERVMGRTKAKNLHLLVATDIAARGIDITDLSHVINFTFPESAEVYVHRTGRTGRAGKKGTAISLISPRELGNFYMLKLTYKIKPEERALPAESEMATVREGARVEELRRAMGEGATTEEWMAVARRLWAADGGVELVARLIQERVARPVPPPQPRVADEAAASSTAEGAEPRDPRDYEGRGRGDRDRGGRGRDRDRGGRGRDRDRGGRGERDRRDERSARGGEYERGARSEARAEAPAAVEAERPVEASGEAAPAGEASTAGAAAPAPSREREDREGGRRRRRRGERGERGEGRAAGGAPAVSATGTQKITETIDTSDGREFWEAWIDSKSDAPADASAPPSAAPMPSSATDEDSAETSEPRERGDRERGGRRRGGRDRDRGDRGDRGPEPAPLAPGQVRLYLNVGRRDGISDDEIKTFVDQKAVPYAALDVRSSHTYLIADESNENAILAALNGSILGTRDLVCERARR